jgi:hypothetical protein
MRDVRRGAEGSDSRLSRGKEDGRGRTWGMVPQKEANC